MAGEAKPALSSKDTVLTASRILVSDYNKMWATDMTSIFLCSSVLFLFKLLCSIHDMNHFIPKKLFSFNTISVQDNNA